MKKPKSYNAVIIGERGGLFKICHVTQIIAGASLPPTPSFLHFTPPITPPRITSSLRRHFLFSFSFSLSAIHLPPAVCICPGFPSRDERISRSDVLDNCRTPESPGIETTQTAAFSQCFHLDSDRRWYLRNKELTLIITVHCFIYIEVYWIRGSGHNHT